MVENLGTDRGVKPGDDASIGLDPLGTVDEDELPWSGMSDCKKKTQRMLTRL
jgi:hypothetical protein